MSQRINVLLSDDLNAKLNDLSKRYGMPKSSISAFIIGQWIDSHEMAKRAMFDNTAGNVSLLNSVKDIIEKSK